MILDAIKEIRVEQFPSRADFVNQFSDLIQKYNRFCATPLTDDSVVKYLKTATSDDPILLNQVKVARQINDAAVQLGRAMTLTPGEMVDLYHNSGVEMDDNTLKNPLEAWRPHTRRHVLSASRGLHNCSNPFIDWNTNVAYVTDDIAANNVNYIPITQDMSPNAFDVDLMLQQLEV